MPTPTKGRRLGGSPAHQRHMLANLATALFEHGKITTTEARARRLRPVAERLITFAKRGDLHARRQVLGVVTDKTVVHTLFADIGPSFATRDGGYTRITKVGPRKGDNAALAVIELVREETDTRSRRRRARRAQPAAAPARRVGRRATAAAPAGQSAAAGEPTAAEEPTATDESAVAGEATGAGETTGAGEATGTDQPAAADTAEPQPSAAAEAGPAAGGEADPDAAEHGSQAAAGQPEQDAGADA